MDGKNTLSDSNRFFAIIVIEIKKIYLFKVSNPHPQPTHACAHPPEIWWAAGSGGHRVGAVPSEGSHGD